MYVWEGCLIQTITIWALCIHEGALKVNRCTKPALSRLNTTSGRSHCINCGKGQNDSSWSLDVESFMSREEVSAGDHTYMEEALELDRRRSRVIFPELSPILGLRTLSGKGCWELGWAAGSKAIMTSDSSLCIPPLSCSSSSSSSSLISSQKWAVSPSMMGCSVWLRLLLEGEAWTKENRRRKEKRGQDKRKKEKEREEKEIMNYGKKMGGQLFKMNSHEAQITRLLY